MRPGSLTRPPSPALTPMTHITLYKRTYRVKNAPVSFSLTPFPVDQVHTFPVGGQVYEAKYSKVEVIAPDGVKIDLVQNRLLWGEKNKVKSTPKEVFDLAAAGSSGFGLA